MVDPLNPERQGLLSVGWEGTAKAKTAWQVDGWARELPPVFSAQELEILVVVDIYSLLAEWAFLGWQGCFL